MGLAPSSSLGVGALVPLHLQVSLGGLSAAKIKCAFCARPCPRQLGTHSQGSYYETPALPPPVALGWASDCSLMTALPSTHTPRAPDPR